LNILDLMPKFFNLFLGPLASMFLIGMFATRATARSAIPAVIGSVLISVVWSWWPEIYAVLHGIPRKDAPVPTITLAIAVPYLSGFLLAVVLSFLVERPGPHPGRDYTWRAVLRRPLESE